MDQTEGCQIEGKKNEQNNNAHLFFVTSFINNISTLRLFHCAIIENNFENIFTA